jgi:hypothetical protein
MLSLAACASAPTDPPSAEDVRIVVETTGGIAYMDWRVTLDGKAGTIVLDRCRNLCPSDEVRSIDDDTVEEIAAAFVEAGVSEKAVLDFGICAQCADQFHHSIAYTDDTGSYRVEGDGPNLPPALADAVNRILWRQEPITE